MIDAAVKAYAAAVRSARDTSETLQDFAKKLRQLARPIIVYARPRSEHDVEVIDGALIDALREAQIDPRSGLGRFARERVKEIAMLPWQIAMFSSAPGGTPDLSHSIHANLVWFLGAHGASSTELGKEIISGETMLLGTDADFSGVHPDISDWRCLVTSGTSDNWAASTLTAGVASIGTQYTIWADTVVDSLAAYSTILSVPWRNDASWSSPWTAMHYIRNSTTTNARHRFTEEPSTPNSYISATADSFPSTTGRRRYWMIRDGTSLVFGVDDAQVGSSITVDSSAPYWAGASGNRVTIGNRSPFSPGEYFNGKFLRVMILARAASVSEMEDLNANPQLGLYTY